MFWVTHVALLLRPSGHKSPTDRRDPPWIGRQGPGAGAQRGPQSRGRRTAQSRQQGGGLGRRSSLASHSQLRLQTCSSPPPPHPGPPARLPARLPFCLLSPSVLDGPGPFPGSGYLVSIGAGGARAGGCGGVAGPPAWGAGTVLPPPLSLALPRLPLLPQVGARCRPDFAPRRALLLRAGPLSGPAAAGKRAARGGRDPGPTWLKSPSTSPSCPESRKVGPGARGARGPSPLPAWLSPGGDVVLLAPEALARAPLVPWPRYPGRGQN